MAGKIKRDKLRPPGSKEQRGVTWDSILYEVNDKTYNIEVLYMGDKGKFTVWLCEEERRIMTQVREASDIDLGETENHLPKLIEIAKAIIHENADR